MNITTKDFFKLLDDNYLLIDVRSEDEFAKAHLPGAYNVPILNNLNRASVGTCYKVEGREKAIALGHQLVSGEVRKKTIAAWMDLVTKNNNKIPIVYCWRGGLRSGISQSWMAEAGLSVCRLEGGYKAFKNYLNMNSQLVLEKQKFYVISGMTGSGKTQFLSKLKNKIQTIDLEQLACHRGSAFGHLDIPQPSQAQFDINLSWKILSLTNNVSPWLIEDESRMVGAIVVSETVFNKIRSSQMIHLDVGFDERVENIYSDYILKSGLLLTDRSQRVKVIQRYRMAFQNISKKLGGERYNHCLEIFQRALVEYENRADASLHREWIGILLKEYYDPLYLKSFKKRNPEVIFQGSLTSAEEFLLNSANL